MRLNRGTAIFFIILVVVIGIAYGLMNSDIAGPAEPTATALLRQALFPNLASTDIIAITISSQIPVEDTRPTPLPGAEALPTLTPVAEGEDEPTRAEIFSIRLDEDGTWQVTDDSTLISSSAVEIPKIESALQSIATAQAESFIPESGDYAQYGLDKPSHEITFVVEAAAIEPSTEETSEPSTDEESSTTSEPVTRRLRIGDRTLDNLAYYAFLDDDSETVYIISSASSFQSNILNLVTTPPFEPTPTTIPPIAVNIPGPVFSGFNPSIVARFSMSDNTTDESLILSKPEASIDWTIEDGDPTRAVNQGQVTSAFIDVSSVLAVSRANIEDLATVGLDMPSYAIHTEFFDGRTIDVLLGDKDPTGSLYYTLINDISDVILVNAREIDNLLALIDNPPYTVEVTPELTPEASDVMEATEAAVEATESSD
jgi:hypothetical protein